MTPSGHSSVPHALDFSGDPLSASDSSTPDPSRTALNTPDPPGTHDFLSSPGLSGLPDTTSTTLLCSKSDDSESRMFT